jgi:hypothetical protein
VIDEMTCVLRQLESSDMRMQREEAEIGHYIDSSILHVQFLELYSIGDHATTKEDRTNDERRKERIVDRHYLMRPTSIPLF